MLGKFKLLVGFGWLVSTVTQEEYNMGGVNVSFSVCFLYILLAFFGNCLILLTLQ